MGETSTGRNPADPTRRRLLKRGAVVAGGIAVAAAGGLVWRAAAEDVFSPFDGPAYAPWSDWRTAPLPGPLALVQHAILAASPHNTQPWRFRVQDGRIEVYAERARNLGAFDPFRREMRIGLGCSVENIALAAPALGYAATVEPVEGSLPGRPDAAIERVATISLAPAPATGDDGELYRAIAQRHTDRGPYDPSRGVPAGFLQAARRFVEAQGVRLDLFEAGGQRQTFDRLMIDATRAIVEDGEMEADSQHWFRKGPRAIARHRDGLTLDAVGLPPAMTVLAKLLPAMDAETAHRYWERQTREVHLASARMTGLLSLPDRYDGAGNLRAGRVWQHLHLLAVTHGLAVQPMNQPVEVADRQRQRGLPASIDARFAALLDTPGWQPTFAFRIGHPTRPALPSPRRAAQDCLA
ncbi:MAG TPA: hypothetical protein VE631_06250 [Alphaproteobacteria bacterium]|jgi:hypothetical protein|nr:hypothetical protein [Alphaproteobacteria bacterium]